MNANNLPARLFIAAVLLASLVAPAATAGDMFWDGIHPTRAGHAILAQEAAGLLR
jgi:phospholipase/lecithinase/hemolysin